MSASTHFYSRRMNKLITEVRQAWRSLCNRKTYLGTCVATLTLVLGANAAIFAVVNATMLRPMPFAAAGDVLRLFSQPPGTSSAADRNPLQQMDVPRVRERSRTLARLEGFYPSERVILRDGEPEVAPAAAVTPGLFPLMGAPMARGRAFTAQEGEPGHPVAVITDGYWKQAMGGGQVLGQSLVIDNQPHVIVGILAPSFAAPFLGEAEIFTPLVPNAEPQPRAPPRSVVGLAELAPDATVADARQELATISSQLAQEHPRTHTGWVLGAETVREWQYGSLQAPLLMLLGAAAFVLLIACVNIANLTAAQSTARTGELSLRLALGASRSDVLRLHLIELLIVCLCGLVPGLLVAWLAVPALLSIDPAIARTLGPVVIDWRVLSFSAGLAVLTAAMAAAIPAVRAVRGDISTLISATGVRTTAGRGVALARRVLVASEVALCVALLMAGGVLIQGLRELAARGPGYESSGVLSAQIRLPEASYKTPAQRAIVVQDMLDGVRAISGVRTAAITQNAFVPGFSYQTLLHIKDQPTQDGQPHTVQFRRVSPGYFETMQIRILEGRGFADADTADGLPVAVISRRFADTLFPGMDPLGRVIVRTGANPAVTVVGVAEDVSDVSVTQPPEPTLYLPWAQNNNFGVPVAFVIRTDGDPLALLPAVRDVLRGVDASLPVRRAQPLDAFVQQSTAPERFRTVVMGVVALLGLLLAVVGISGVTARGVIDRSREFAVRMALGAGSADVIRLVVFQLMRDLGFGVIGGLIGGAALCAGLASAMQNVAGVDAGTTGVAVALIAVTGLFAALLPAMQILRVRPAEVLRG